MDISLNIFNYLKDLILENVQFVCIVISLIAMFIGYSILWRKNLKFSNNEFKIKPFYLFLYIAGICVLGVLTLWIINKFY